MSVEVVLLSLRRNIVYLKCITTQDAWPSNSHTLPSSHREQPAPSLPKEGPRSPTPNYYLLTSLSERCQIKLSSKADKEGSRERKGHWPSRSSVGRESKESPDTERSVPVRAKEAKNTFSVFSQSSASSPSAKAESGSNLSSKTVRREV